MSNTTNTKLSTIETEIRASNLTPQVRTWLLEMIASMLKTEARIHALEAEVKELDEDGVDDEGRLGKIEVRLAKLEGELEGAGEGVAGLTAMLEAMGQDLAAKLAPVRQVEPAVQKLHAHVENLEWLQGARANLDKIVTFLWPLIGEATPPLDGAQIATRAMLDQQLATLSRALHDTINRVRRDVGDRLDELEDDIVAAGDPRAMLRRLFRRGK